MTRCIVLDAMGVIFSAGDDVAELLVPFVQRSRPRTPSSAIEAAYLEASLGAITADQFWIGLGLDPSVEDAYLQGHALVPGTLKFLQTSKAYGVPVWCLSNDVERWSLKLRRKFELDQYLEGAIISSAVQARKPDRAIYAHLLENCGYLAEDLFFVDDRPRNVAAASQLGIHAFHFRDSTSYEEITRMTLDRAAQQPHAAARRP